MMKILVISDSHGNIVMVQNIIDRATPFDRLVHCGDGIADLLRVRLPRGASITRVAGNVDRARGIDIPAVEVVESQGLRILVTHGDAFHVKNDYGMIAGAAADHGFDGVLFGHTHIKYLRKQRPFLFNPGPALGGSYGIIEFTEGIPVFRHERVEDAEDEATGDSLP